MCCSVLYQLLKFMFLFSPSLSHINVNIYFLSLSISSLIFLLILSTYDYHIFNFSLYYGWAVYAWLVVAVQRKIAVVQQRKHLMISLAVFLFEQLLQIFLRNLVTTGISEILQRSTWRLLEGSMLLIAASQQRQITDTITKMHWTVYNLAMSQMLGLQYKCVDLHSLKAPKLQTLRWLPSLVCKLMFDGNYEWHCSTVVTVHYADTEQR